MIAYRSFSHEFECMRAADEDAGYRDSDEESDGEAYDVGMEDAFLEYAVGVGMSFSATMKIVNSRKVRRFLSYSELVFSHDCCA
jgi:hypothetical protein